MRREKAIAFLQRKFKIHHMKGVLVFDGKIRRDEESGRNYAAPLEICYTPYGESADAYILHYLEKEKKRGCITVVTNDRGIIANAHSLGAKTMSPAELMQRLSKPGKKMKLPPKEISESQKNRDRLQKIFEERLKENPSP